MTTGMIFQLYVDIDVDIAIVVVVPDVVTTMYSFDPEQLEEMVVMKGLVFVGVTDGTVIVHEHAVLRRHGAGAHCDDEVTQVVDVGDDNAQDDIVYTPGDDCTKYHTDVLSRLFVRHSCVFEHAVVKNSDDTVSCINAQKEVVETDGAVQYHPEDVVDVCISAVYVVGVETEVGKGTKTMTEFKKDGSINAVKKESVGVWSNIST